MKEPTCKERVNDHAESRLEDIRTLWMIESTGLDPDNSSYEMGTMNEYGLDFSYQMPDEQTLEGYFCYLLSTGGPHEEFRFFTTQGQHGPLVHRVEFWFMDWFDGAKAIIQGEDYDMMCEIFEWFVPCEETNQHYIKNAIG